MNVVTGDQTLVAAIDNIDEFVGDDDSFALSTARWLNNPILRRVKIHLHPEVLEIFRQHVTLRKKVEVLSAMVLLHPLNPPNEIIFPCYFNRPRKLVYLLVFVKLVECWVFHYFGAPDQRPRCLVILRWLGLPFLDLALGGHPPVSS